MQIAAGGGKDRAQSLSVKAAIISKEVDILHRNVVPDIDTGT